MHARNLKVYCENAKWSKKQTLAWRYFIGKRTNVRIGDKVRRNGIPARLEDFPDMDDMPGLTTKSTFARCLGHEFVISAITDEGGIELPIGSVTGHRDEKISASPAFLELVSGAENP